MRSRTLRLKPRRPSAVFLIIATPMIMWAQTEPIKISGTDSAKLLINPHRAPNLSLLARQARMSGSVWLEFTVLADGTTTDITDSDNTPRLEGRNMDSPNSLVVQASKDAVSTWKYSPYLVNGQPKAIRTTVQFKFANGSLSETVYNTALPRPPGASSPETSATAEHAPIRTGTPSSLAAQSDPPFGAPKSMRLCFRGCEKLTWVNGHYDGVKEEDGTLSTTYTLVHWQSDGIEINGKSVIAGGAGMGSTRFTGKLGEGRITDPKAIWQVGSQSIPVPFNLSWEPAPLRSSAPPPAPPPAKPAPILIRAGTPNPIPVTLDNHFLLQHHLPTPLTAFSISEMMSGVETRVNEDYLLEGAATLGAGRPRITRLNLDAVYGYKNFHPAVVAAIFSDGTAFGEEKQIDDFMAARNLEQGLLRDMAKEICALNRQGLGMNEVMTKYQSFGGTQAYQWLGRNFRNMRHFRDVGETQMQQLLKAMSDRRNAMLSVPVRNAVGRLYISDRPEPLTCPATR